MSKAVAFSNNDVAFMAWNYENAIPKCLGFAVYRTDLRTGIREALPAWVGFEGQSNKDWKPQTTEVWPIQKFNWRDLTARHGSSYTYEIVPMVGKPDDLKPLPSQSLQTNRVDLAPLNGRFSAYFNRGILSTQYLAHQVPAGPSGAPNYHVLKDRIDQPGDPLRNSLAGQIIDALSYLLNRANTNGGRCYCALYELDDPELLQLLIQSAGRVHIVLSNTGADDEENAAGRQTLKEAGAEVIDRMLANGHIGHNKFVVYEDENGQPQAVLTGSTNWTYTALCGQSNNALLIKSPELASAYLDYWKRLKEDGEEQSVEFRASNQKVQSIQVEQTDISLWFSPNTKQKNKPAKDAPQPSDMKDVFDAIEAAKHGILFLVFQPGSPSILDPIGDIQAQGSGLFIRGAATDPQAVKKYNVDLYHRTGKKADTVVAAAAIDDEFSFWQKELLKSSPTAHAIIHDKTIVIDPFSSNCTVITGSHNLGYRASFNNDENLVIIRGNRELAASYAVHIMDIYDHYRWRYTIQNKGKKAWQGLSRTDSWQDFYFKPGIQKEMGFWLDS